MSRPEPPEDLTEDEAYEWREIVTRLPSDWFPRETHAMLTALCRHTVTANVVAKLLSKFQKDMKPVLEGNDQAALSDAIKGLDRLLKLQAKETARIATLSTKLRISQQSQYGRLKKRNETPQAETPFED